MRPFRLPTKMMAAKRYEADIEKKKFDLELENLELERASKAAKISLDSASVRMVRPAARICSNVSVTC